MLSVYDSVSVIMSLSCYNFPHKSISSPYWLSKDLIYDFDIRHKRQYISQQLQPNIMNFPVVLVIFND